MLGARRTTLSSSDRAARALERDVVTRRRAQEKRVEAGGPVVAVPRVAGARDGKEVLAGGIALDETPKRRHLRLGECDGARRTSAFAPKARHELAGRDQARNGLRRCGGAREREHATHEPTK